LWNLLTSALWTDLKKIKLTADKKERFNRKSVLFYAGISYDLLS